MNSTDKKIVQLVCPSCQARSRIGAAQIPQAGAWARCPKCRERFFVRHPSASTAPLQDVFTAGQRPAGRSQAEEELLARMRRQNPSLAEKKVDLEPELVTIYPESVTGYSLYYAVAAILAVAALAVPIYFFRLSAQGGPAPGPVATVAQESAEYGDRNFQLDLIALRSAISRQSSVNRQVDFSGLESRIFKYALANLAPYECQEIVSLHLNSSRPVSGFYADAVCLDNNRPSPRLLVSWPAGEAMVTVQGSGRAITVPISRARIFSGQDQTGQPKG